MSKMKLIPFKVNKVIMKVDDIPYGVKMIQAPKLWDKGIKGKGVVVAIIDTGCDTKHSSLMGSIIGGYNFTSDHKGDTSIYSDNNGHGTHVAGIIAAKINNCGVIGVAPESKILILKALSSNGQGDYTNIINSIKYAITWRGLKGEKVRIISMSIGGSEDIPKLYDVIKDAIKNNILIVCSAGNMGDGYIKTIERQYPGNYSEVVQVGAVDINGELAYFSNTNDEIDIVAPGAAALLLEAAEKNVIGQ